MKKKLLSVLLSLGMVTGLLAGCGVSTDTGSAPAAGGNAETAAAETQAGGEAASGDVVEITWMFWDDLEATEDLMTKGYKEVIDRFNSDYAGTYHCNVITTNLEEYDTKLNALIAAGDAPDLFICNPGPNLTQYVEAGMAADLTDILTNQEKEWYDSFSGGIFDRITYDGKIMAVPTNFAAACSNLFCSSLRIL